MIDANVHAVPLEARLRNAYIRQRRALIWQRERRVEEVGNDYVPSWDGGVDTYMKNHRSAWPRIAAAMEAVDCYDAEGYMAAQFFGARRVPTPQQLSGQDAMAKYRRYVNTSDRILGDDLTAERLAFEVAVNVTKEWMPASEIREIWAHVLCNTAWDLSPLFRYCVSVAETFDDIAKRWEYVAYEQLTSDPVGYLRCWQKILPPAMLEHANRFANATH